MPLFSGRVGADLQLEPLGSVTNQTYRVTIDQLSYAVRIAGPTTRYLDRDIETHNASIAAALGLTPPILYLDDDLMVTSFVDGARPLAPADYDQPDRLAQVAELLSRLQSSSRPFKGERHPFGETDRYLGEHRHARAAALREAARPVEAALARSAGGLVPAHVDASAANFLLGGDGRLWLVDWEFSSMADPAWDPASVFMHRSTDCDEPARRFVSLIFGDDSERNMARVGLFKTALTLVAGSWCAMEAAARRDHALMRAAESYLDRCEVFLADPRLQRWLQIV